MGLLNQRNHVIVSGHNQEKHVLYIMMKSFRIQNNYGLYQSIEYSKKHECPLRIIVVDPYETNQRNLDFFHQYLDDLLSKLNQYTKDVRWIQRDESIKQYLEDVHTIFIDKSYLKFDLEVFRTIKTLSYEKEIILIEVESNVFVPVTLASNKEEYQARTIRPKIHKLLDEFNEEVLVNETASKAEIEALKILNEFINDKLPQYDQHNDPSLEKTSNLSPYLKYGFISPVTIYNKFQKPFDENAESFLEELIVRRELAYNYVYYNQGYDAFETMTEDWAYLTMKQHINDKREYVYTLEDYILFKTHDPYFNAAMMEMLNLGRMHSYMRMYWCKKIIEWSKTYKEAYEIAISLNNHYFYDGLTPNGYTGVAWCFGKHDRAWFERDIFGKLRYMNDNGLKRKFNIEDYVKKMNLLRGE